ncbi:MAG: dTDP-4-dehydrorhamnose reductase [Verrucomicrobia bacterium]|nr:MAG: dTDP-4-dehydrorhamnose reductase [Verrucomicrobiota bacterium]
MKITILGARGMLGRDLGDICRAAGHETVEYDLPELDVTDAVGVFRTIPECDWVVNCAAYTDVDGAQSHREEAFAVNCDGARNVARACARKRIPLLHISTDYVFNGYRNTPYAENDEPDPINIYGASKLAGEKAIKAEGGRYVIVRTQALFGRHGHNFVKAIIRLLQEKDSLGVVVDQVTCPTYTRHLAEAVESLLHLDFTGVIHVSAEGECSWYRFAREIAAHVRPSVEINPITSVDLGRPARRPPYAVLDKKRFTLLTGRKMPHWQQGLVEYLQEEGLLPAEGRQGEENG